MKVGGVCSREVYVVTADQSLEHAARKLRNRRVDSVVVVETLTTSMRPVGMITDHDIVSGQLAHQADLHCLSVGEVMTVDPLVVLEGADVDEAITSLRIRGVHRAPVVDVDGNLVGIVTFDDLLAAVTDDLSRLSRAIGAKVQPRC